MRTYVLPPAFDGAKFAKRYGLDSMKDFYVRDKELIVFKDIADDPPIFEPPDPPGPGISVRLDNVRTLPELIAILKEELH